MNAAHLFIPPGPVDPKWLKRTVKSICMPDEVVRACLAVPAELRPAKAFLSGLVHGAYSALCSAHASGRNVPLTAVPVRAAAGECWAGLVASHVALPPRLVLSGGQGWHRLTQSIWRAGCKEGLARAISLLPERERSEG